MKNIQLLVLFISSFLIIGCVSYSKVARTNKYNISKQNLHQLDGKYKIYQKKQSERSDSIQNISLYKNISSDYWWKNKIEADTLNTEQDNYYIQLLVKNNSELNIKMYKNNSEIKSTTIKGKLKNGMFYLKRKIGISGIPYVFGTFLIDKKRIGITKNKNLIIDAVKGESGAIFLIFEASFEYKRYYEYEKIK